MSDRCRSTAAQRQAEYAKRKVLGLEQRRPAIDPASIPKLAARGLIPAKAIGNRFLEDEAIGLLLDDLADGKISDVVRNGESRRVGSPDDER